MSARPAEDVLLAVKERDLDKRVAAFLCAIGPDQLDPGAAILAKADREAVMFAADFALFHAAATGLEITDAGRDFVRRVSEQQSGK